MVSIGLTSCDYLCINISDAKHIASKLHIFYHTPGDNLTSIDEIMEIMASNANSQVHHIFLGDFNLHWNNVNNPIVGCLKEFLSVQELSQFCDSPTHNKGETLDLIIAKPNIILLEFITPCDWSDHYCILFSINSEATQKRGQPSKTRQWKRNLQNINPITLVNRGNSTLTPMMDLTDIHDLTTFYNDSLLKILDSTAPFQEKNISSKISKLWFNEGLNAERRQLRVAQRLWKSAPTTDNLEHLRRSRNSYNRKILKAKADFFRTQLNQASNRPKKLFEIIKHQSCNTTNSRELNNLATPTCDVLANFFHEKTKTIELDIQSKMALPQTMVQILTVETHSKYFLIIQGKSQKTMHHGTPSRQSLNKLSTTLFKQSTPPIISLTPCLQPC